jgi:hypothetical protein
VVLLDEIEKAHPDVFNILLQILEDGRLTDAQGRTVDFRNCIVIMTSNIGATTISKGQTLGFGDQVEEGGLEYDEMKTRVTGELKKMFKPEFLNRVDEVIVFRKLTRVEIADIVALMMARVEDQLKDREIGLALTLEAKELLVNVVTIPPWGAPLRRAIQRHVEDLLADEVLAASRGAAPCSWTATTTTSPSARSSSARRRSSWATSPRRAERLMPRGKTDPELFSEGAQAEGPSSASSAHAGVMGEVRLDAVLYFVAFDTESSPRVAPSSPPRTARLHSSPFVCCHVTPLRAPIREDLMSSAKLRVGNLSYETSQAGLRTLFERHGAVVSVTLMFNRASGRSCFAFVGGHSRTGPSGQERRRRRSARRALAHGR